MAAGSMKVAILASGEGTNAERLIRAAEKRSDIEIEVVASNRVGAGVLRRAESLGARTWVFSKAQLNGGSVAQELAAQGVQFVVLMGFFAEGAGSVGSGFFWAHFEPASVPSAGFWRQGHVWRPCAQSGPQRPAGGVGK